MKLYDYEDRLIATDDDGTKGVVWSAGEWRPIAPSFAGKAWIEGDPLTQQQAAERFPDVNHDALARLNL